MRMNIKYVIVLNVEINWLIKKNILDLLKILKMVLFLKEEIKLLLKKKYGLDFVKNVGSLEVKNLFLK
jgi:hypothetical protein